MLEPDIDLAPQAAAEAANRKPSSPRRVQSSRENGKLSRGPVTPEGRLACANNPMKHGMLAQAVVLREESKERFTLMLESLIDTHRPMTGPELDLVHKMAAAQWRQMRAMSIQTIDLELETARQDDSFPASIRTTVAFGNLNTRQSAAHNTAIRYETTFDRQFSRALRDLLLLQSQRDASANLPPPPNAFDSGTWFNSQPCPDHEETV